MKLPHIFAIVVLSISLSLHAQSPDEALAAFNLRYGNNPPTPVKAMLRLPLNNAQRQALTFLYAYMPWADVVDYDVDFFLRHADVALRARKATAWGASVPDREWQHFVLPVRVNNEFMDTFRLAFYDELISRVRNLNMTDAALEVNHWCHEHLTYQPSDARTSAPLTSLRTATGRCGEESTLAVAALRTVGIPARQVYTPRWAHSDDNHAWVEVWIDGRWYFMGACEPAPKLNVAWFNQPAARGMLMNTTVLGRYDGPEDVVKQFPRQTTINVTENYAPVARSYVRVVDDKGNAVEGADISFRIYNYAEFYPVFETQTNAEGLASMTSGLGDMIVWASHKQRFGLAVLRGGQPDTLNLCLNHAEGEAFDTDLAITPPAESHNYPFVAPEEQAACDKRLAAEDALRAAYVATFAHDDRIRAFCNRFAYDFNEVAPLVYNAKGNYDAIFDILQQACSNEVIRVCGVSQSKKQWAVALLRSLTDKDMRDITAPTLLSHLDALATLPQQHTLDIAPDSLKALVEKYVASPRVAVEQLSCWRAELGRLIPKKLQKQMRANPIRIREWINSHVGTDTDQNSRYICTLPAKAISSGHAEAYSKGLLFVAMARTVGRAARIDEVTGNVQFYDRGWTTVHFDDHATEAQPREVNLQLNYDAQPYIADPHYYTHFTLSRLKNGQPSLLEYPEEATWASTFKTGAPTAIGNYLLLTGTREANGSVRAHAKVFALQKDTAVALQLNRATDKISVIGSYNSENTYFDIISQTEKSVLSSTGRGYFAVALLTANNEPSTHILHDLEAERKALEAWGRTILVLFPNRAEFDAWNARRDEYPNLPNNLVFGLDTNNASANELFGSELTKTSERPLLIVADTFNRVVFCSQGYTIGIGSRLLKTLSQL